VINPITNALNTYQLKRLNPSKKNNECLKPENGNCRRNKGISKVKKGFWNTHFQGKGISSNKLSLYKGTYGD
jgi:hypothetical protein